MNGVNLDHFQFEYDLTWMSFFEDANGGTYARYGGRDDENAESHLTKASLIQTMQRVLERHAKNQVQKQSRYEPAAQTVSTPLDILTMRNMIVARTDSQCIHCHDVKVARLMHLQEHGKIEKESVFTYPSPSNFGLHVDPNQQNRIARIDDDSPAAVAGLLPGDELDSSDGQRILTFADFTRVLEFAPKSGELTLAASRNGERKQFTIALPAGWRGKGKDPSWRPSLHAVGPGGGFWGLPLSKPKRREVGIDNNDLAIQANFIWAEHAKQSGLKNDDVLVSVDGQTNDMNMRQLHAYLQLNRNWGDTINLVVLRNGAKKELKMKLPEAPQ